jgi:glycosyltransferase 2 family protein
MQNNELKKNQKLKIAIFVFKSILGCAILWFLFHQDSFVLPSLTAGVISPLPLIFAFLLILLSILIGASRWWLLLQSQGVQIPYLKILRINWIGAFANIFLPTGIGGDTFRLFYVCRETPSKKALAVTTVIVDRFIGLLALTILVLVSIVITLSVMSDNETLRSLASQIGFALVFFLILTAIAIYFVMNTTRKKIIFRLIPWKKLQSLVLSFFSAIRAYYKKLGVIAISIFLSLMIHMLTILAIVLVGQMLFPNLISVWGYFFATPLSMIANQLPLTPGGIGIAELSFDQICRVISPQSGVGFATIFLTFRALFILNSLAGGVIWIFYQKTDE